MVCQGKTAQMANRVLLVLTVLKAQTVSRRTTATMATGILARPIPESRRAGQPARRARMAKRATPARRVLLDLLDLLVYPARTARTEQTV